MIHVLLNLKCKKADFFVFVFLFPPLVNEEETCLKFRVCYCELVHIKIYIILYYGGNSGKLNLNSVIGLICPS